MTNSVNNISSGLPWDRTRVNSSVQNVNIDDIDELYLTTKTETERTTFSETFPEEERFSTNLSPQAKSSKFQIDAYEFWDTLCQAREDNPKNGTTSLRDKLNLTDDQYDSLACIALAIATQETGMGWETEYKNEQSGAWANIRKLGIIFFNDKSASSGLTQIKLYDQMEEMDTWHKGILSQYGIETSAGILGKGYDNLNDPQKSAVATMVVLQSIMTKYDDYQDVMNNKHDELTQKFEAEGQDAQTCEEIGFDYMSQIYEKYQNSTDEEKLEIRDSLKYLFLAQDGTTLDNPSKSGKEYTEEYQLQRLQNALGDLDFPNEAIEYVRYAMTSEVSQMDMTEYCAYAWNKGTGTTGMQPDRAIAEKLGIILSNPEDFDYEQYAANVVQLATHYAEQTTQQGNDGYFAINDSIQDYNENQFKRVP